MSVNKNAALRPVLTSKIWCVARGRNPQHVPQLVAAGRSQASGKSRPSLLLGSATAVSHPSQPARGRPHPLDRPVVGRARIPRIVKGGLQACVPLSLRACEPACVRACVRASLRAFRAAAPPPRRPTAAPSAPAWTPPRTWRPRCGAQSRSCGTSGTRPVRRNVRRAEARHVTSRASISFRDDQRSAKRTHVHVHCAEP